MSFSVVLQNLTQQELSEFVFYCWAHQQIPTARALKQWRSSK